MQIGEIVRAAVVSDCSDAGHRRIRQDKRMNHQRKTCHLKTTIV